MNSKYKLLYSEDAERDLDLIYEFIFESYVSFGENAEIAIARARERTKSIRKQTEKLAENPFRGTLHNDILSGLRHITIDRAVYWFDIDKEEMCVRVLAVFYGGQDHIRHMLMRLLSQKI